MAMSSAPANTSRIKFPEITVCLCSHKLPEYIRELWAPLWEVVIQLDGARLFVREEPPQVNEDGQPHGIGRSFSWEKGGLKPLSLRKDGGFS